MTRAGRSPRVKRAAPGILVGLGFGSALAAASCLVTNPDHCALQGGACGEGLVCSMCAAENNGCVADRTPECAYSDETETGTTTTSDPTDMPTTGSTTDDPTTGTSDPATTDVTTGTSTTTEPPSCDPDDPDNGDCDDPAAPYCITPDTCGTCEDLIEAGKFCSGLSVNTPACDAASGLCVECTVDDTTACSNVNQPVCNPYTLSCDSCREHDQCPSGACDLSSGQCLSGDVIYVKKRANCAGEDGSMAKPYCPLWKAVADAMPNDPEGTIIKVLHESDSFPQDALTVIDGPYKIAIVGELGNEALFAYDVDGAAIDARGGAVVFLAHLRFEDSPAADPGSISVEGTNSRVWVDRTRITGNFRPIHVGIGGELHLRRSVILDNTDGVLVQGKFVARNSFISFNGLLNTVEGEDPGANKYPAFALAGAGSVDFSFTTVVGNGALGTSFGDCTAANNQQASSVRNSVVVGKTPLFKEGQMDCMMSIDKGGNHFATFPGGYEDADFADVFDGSPTDGVLRALVGGALENLAVRAEGDPFGDYDGDGRPLEIGAPDYAGADRP